MEFNIKIEPIEGTSELVELLSDTEVSSEVPLEVLGMKSPERPARPGTPPDIHCSICLEEYNDQCHPDICCHKFCFECLKRWSFIEASCPLCKKDFKQIFHTLVDDIFTSVYDVISARPRIVLRPYGQLIDENSGLFSQFSVNMLVGDLRRNFRDDNYNVGVYAQLNIGRESSNHISNVHPIRLQSIDVHIMRRQVYTEDMWAEPLPDLSGRFRDCSATFYRHNPIQTYRLHGFIIRDIAILRNLISLEPRRGPSSSINDEALTTYIMRSVLLCEIRDVRLISILTPYIGQYADHFLHELHNFAISPYDLVGYDRHVRYNTGQQRRRFLIPYSDFPELSDEEFIELPTPDQRGTHYFNNSTETIVVNSDDGDDEIIPPRSEVIVINSSEDTEESDIEIINIIDTEPSDTFSRDQPSTSTGIRDSSNRPNTRYNLRRRRLFQPNQQPNCSSSTQPNESQMNTVERIVVDSSSDDEAIETNTRAKPTVKKSEVIVNKRKRKTKKSKLRRKKKNVVESRREVRLGIRTRSGSESSSSGDIDTNSRRNLMNTRNVNS